MGSWLPAEVIHGHLDGTETTPGALMGLSLRCSMVTSGRGQVQRPHLLVQATTAVENHLLEKSLGSIWQAKQVVTSPLITTSS